MSKDYVSRTECDSILRCVAQKHGCSLPELRGERRLPHIVSARREAAHILRGRGLSYPAIGKALGGKHHSTVIHLLDGHSKTLRLPPESDIETIRLKAIQAKAYIEGLIAEIDRQLRGSE